VQTHDAALHATLPEITKLFRKIVSTSEIVVRYVADNVESCRVLLLRRRSQQISSREKSFDVASNGMTLSAKEMRLFWSNAGLGCNFN
jgi:hypothetical protein